MSTNLLKSPDSLHNLCVGAVVDHYSDFRNEVRSVPVNILFDIYYKLYKELKLCIVNIELSDLDVFASLLKLSNKRLQLLRLFQALMDHRTEIAKELANKYLRKCGSVEANPSSRNAVIELGLRLGHFLSDAGWFAASEKVLLGCQKLCLVPNPTVHSLRLLLECCHKLLHTQAAFYRFSGADETLQLAFYVINELEKLKAPMNLAGLYTEFSVLYFCRSEFADAYKWSIKALSQVDSNLPIQVTIDVLRQVAKSCVIKREFKKAGLLARQAVLLAREVYGTKHPKYSDALNDYAFYLLNFDSVTMSVEVFKGALKIRQALFGDRNLLVAIAHEDLAYALYVQEYNSGRFAKAREHADLAISGMEKLVPADHLMLASVKRVKALILEEIALDTMVNSEGPHKLLLEAEKLHQSALKLTVTTFGEKNVQTAKHFGNLGRLYQSMKKFQDAETMHLKAIAIKEELLGADDYEVGLSIGHLASLYNYHMKKYKKAEGLYCRSIDISLNLFGDRYSGLEYDYRGLIHVYNELDDLSKAAEYTFILNNWKLHRELNASSESNSINLEGTPLPISEITRQFFEAD